MDQKMIGATNRIKRAAERIPFPVWYTVIALFSLMFMIRHGADTSFWFDEFAQICYSGLGNSLVESALVLDPTPPLFNIAANVWYNLMPYGDQWLLLLPQLATAAAVYVVGLWAEEVKGRTVGLCAAILLGSSQMVLEQCGFEFRSYGFYLLFAALAMYLFHRRMAPDWKRTLAGEAVFALTLAALLYCHVFASMIVAVLGMVELALVLRRKRGPVAVIPYFLAGAAFSPWLIRFLLKAGTDVAAAAVDWMVKPTPWEVVKLAAYLCGNHIVVCILFVLGVLSILFAVCRIPADTASRQLLVPMMVGAFQVGVMYLFGIIRADFASLWVKRYFTGLFPCCAVLCAVGLVSTAEWICRRRKKWKSSWIYFIVLGSIVSVFVVRTAAGNTPLGVYYHREAAELLYQQPDIFDKKTIVLSTLGDFVDGWKAYYVERQGERESFLIRSLYDVGQEEILDYKVVYLDHGFLEAESQVREMLNSRYICSQEWEKESLSRYVRAD